MDQYQFIVLLVIQILNGLLTAFSLVKKRHFYSQCCKGCFELENDVEMKDSIPNIVVTPPPNSQ